MIEAQFASLPDQPTLAPASVSTSSNGKGTYKKNSTGPKISIAEDEFDDGEVSPELIAEDSDGDAEEVIREKRRNTKKVFYLESLSYRFSNSIDSRRVVPSRTL
jgi:hypothetical protein